MRKRIDVKKLLKNIKSGYRDLEDWVLLLLYAAPRNSLPGELHIQKGIFLVSEYLEELGNLVEFKSYRLGPYSDELKDSLLVLESSNRISKKEGIRPTKEGLKRAEELWKKLDDGAKKILKEVSEFISKLTPDELMLYVYIVKGWKDKSDVFDRLLEKRVELAISMWKKGLVSVSLASKLAGKSLKDFIEILKRRGYKPFKAEVDDIEIGAAA